MIDQNSNEKYEGYKDDGVYQNSKLVTNALTSLILVNFLALS